MARVTNQPYTGGNIRFRHADVLMADRLADREGDRARLDATGSAVTEGLGAAVELVIAKEPA